MNLCTRASRMSDVAPAIRLFCPQLMTCDARGSKNEENFVFGGRTGALCSQLFVTRSHRMS